MVMNKFLRKVEKYGVEMYDSDLLEISESIGVGGYGEVYRGRVNGKERALKRLFFEMDDKKELEKFLCDLLRELVYSKELVSKRFTRVYGISYDKNNEELYVIMELLTTEDLSKYLKKNKLCREEKKEIFDSLVLAVKELHELNYIHCDLKPENLCYYHDYNKGTKYIKILDYNLMTRLESDEEVMEGYSGTYGYSAPEQYQNIICKKSDMYALGVIYLEMLCENLWENVPNNYQKCRKQVLLKLGDITEDIEYEKVRGLLRIGYKKRVKI